MIKKLLNLLSLVVVTAAYASRELTAFNAPVILGTAGDFVILAKTTVDASTSRRRELTSQRHRRQPRCTALVAWGIPSQWLIRRAAPIFNFNPGNGSCLHGISLCAHSIEDDEG